MCTGMQECTSRHTHTLSNRLIHCSHTHTLSISPSVSPHLHIGGWSGLQVRCLDFNPSAFFILVLTPRLPTVQWATRTNAVTLTQSLFVVTLCATRAGWMEQINSSELCAPCLSNYKRLHCSTAIPPGEMQSYIL